MNIKAINSNNFNERTKKPSNDILENNELLQYKIVYWGPGESGKTTNYMQLKKTFNNQSLNSGLSIETTDGRTLWQDSIYLMFKANVKEIQLNIITQLITCTGQERFLSTREYVLNGADGIIFVADSNPIKMEQNMRSYRELLAYVSINKIPYLIQLNKRDLKNAIPIKEFKRKLGLPQFESYDDGTMVVYPSIAINNKNVRDIFVDLMTLILISTLSNSVQ
ncbi:MAG: GTP-binding protein [Promethearchaeota archaeon]